MNISSDRIKKVAKNTARPLYKKSKPILKKSKKALKLATSSSARSYRSSFITYNNALKENKNINAANVWIDYLTIEKDPTFRIEALKNLINTYNLDNKFSESIKIIEKEQQRYPLNQKVSDDDLRLWLELSTLKANTNLLDMIENVKDYKKDIKKYVDTRKNYKSGHPKIAVYTAVSGGYDAIKPPRFIDERFDYFIFTDTPMENIGIYNIKPLPYIDADNTRSARYVKTNPHKLLPDYDIAIWVDSNLMITGDFYTLIEPILSNQFQVGAFLHPSRADLYKEMEACIKQRKDDAQSIINQKTHYENKNYYSDKLIESNFMAFNLNNDRVKNFLNDWWNEIDKFSRRDQLSLNYCLDKNNIKWKTFTNRPNSSRDNKYLALVNHGPASGAQNRLMNMLQTQKTNPFEQRPYSSIKHKYPKDKAIDIIYCVHNALDDVKVCLKSVEEHYEKNQNLIIIDDGSEKDTKQFLESYIKSKKWAKIIRNEIAGGYTKAANLGLKESSSDFVILLNSDTIVTSNWANKLFEVAQNNAGVGIVGPLSSAASTQSIPDYKSTKKQTAINQLPKGITPEYLNKKCEEWASEYLAPRVPLIHGFCFGIKRDVINSIGYFDEDCFPNGYGEENDYCFRAADAGYSLAVATNTYIYHAKSKSYKSKTREKLMQDGARSLRDKHGQIRIDRSVKTMINNSVLQGMRYNAQKLYNYKILKSTQLNNEHFVDFEPNIINKGYQPTVNTLTRYNSNLNWESFKKRSNYDYEVSVIVLVLNNITLTKRCIDSIINTKNNTKFELILANNGSNIETAEMLREYKQKNIKIIQMYENTNFALGNNIAFTHSNGKYCIFINNDTIVSDNWLDLMINELNKDKVKIVQPALYYPDNTVQCIGVVFSKNNSLGYPVYVGEPKYSRYIKSRNFHATTGACMGIKSSDYADALGFDPSYINGQEDIDLCLRVCNNKPLCKCVHESVVYHDESKTPGRGKYVEENRRLFINRWKNKVKADDFRIYKEDEVVVDSYKADSRESMEKGIAVYRASFK